MVIHMNKKRNAYKKDMWSAIKQNKKRFFAIMVIVCLGTTMFSGLKAACVDLRHSADNFFDAQKLFDVCVMSTLGLTEEDIEVLNSLDEVAQAEGVYSETVHAFTNGKDLSVALKTYQPNGLNQPYLVEGTLPEKANEAAVTEKFAKEAGLWIGDILSISEEAEEGEEASFLQTEFEISAIITDVLDINNANGSVAFRTSAVEEDTVYILPEAVNSEIYTVVYLTLTGSEALFCYSEEYEARVKDFMDYLEAGIMEQRTKERTEQVKADAYNVLADKEKAVYEELADARQKLLDGEAAISQKEAELAEGWREYQEGLEEAEQEFAEARQEIADMEMAEWYIQDRSSLSGYSNVKSDALSIEAIGTVFPILFFVVAILISLTTITRMVEEDRGLIGTYKALGFLNREIRRKYLLYAACAGISGAVLGTIGAFVVLPAIIFYIFGTMYLLPDYVFLFEPVSGISGPVIFVGGILFATLIACRNELVETPVSLMRPKTPRAGARVFLERIPFVWNRMSFLNKVTIRNLFRYKKRLFMTVFGIMGCMALLLFGFSIKDSVTDLVPRQYEQTFYYDAMAVAADNEKLLAYLQTDEEVEEYLNVLISTVKLMNTEGKTESVQLVVVPKAEAFSSYIQLRNLSSEEITLKEGEVLLTQNASILLGIEAGEEAVLQTLNLDRARVQVSGIVQNYLGNYIYMTQDTYEQYGMEYEPNGAFIYLSEQCMDVTAYSRAFADREDIMTCVSTEEMKDQFSSAFTLINMVVYIVIIMAACLAFVVLFTLATTNISERTRELATIKVLGFYDREVHAYVNKETMLLTGMGILLGVPAGYAFAQTLTVILTLPSIYLAVSLHPISYFISGGLSFLFALLVNKLTDRSLNGIDPVEALKSIE